MMGSLFISCTTGTISIDKVKGHNISVYVERGKVEIRKIVEGNTSIFCQDLTAKMINGDAVRLHCQGTAKIETMYGKDTLLSTGGPLQIDAFRGLLQVCKGVVVMVAALVLFSTMCVVLTGKDLTRQHCDQWL